MFSRFTKSVVKNLGQGKYYGGHENMKMTLFGTTRQINKTLSGSMKNGTKLKAATSNSSRSRSSRLLIGKSEKSRSTNYPGSSNISASRIEKLSQKRFPMKNGMLPYFPNRELDLEKTLIELRDKELEYSTGNASMKNETDTSEQRSITRFPLSEARVTGLMGVLSRLPTTATDSPALPGRQLAQTRSDESPYTPFTSQPWDLDGRLSGGREFTNISEERHTAIRRLASDTPNRNQNDDYYPQGDEYEDEIGVNDSGQSMPEPKKSPKNRGRQKAPKVEEDYDNFSTNALFTRGMFPNPINFHIEPTSIVLSKNSGDKDTLERLQALIDKAVDFKKRIFGSTPQSASLKNEEGTESKIEHSKGNENEDSKMHQSQNSREDQMATDTVWFGDPDCGEGLPERPARGPCHPPDGPCVPMKKPGYPSKPKSQKKDFCFKCPPKKPCNLNKCPPDTDGTWGKAIDQTVDVLNLHSESQAVNDNDVHTSLGISATRFLGGTIWSRNCHLHLYHPKLQLKVPCRSFSKSRACSNSTKKSETTSSMEPNNERESGCKKSSKKVPETSTVCQESSESIKPQEVVPKVLYRKCPPPPKLPRLPKYPEQQRSKATESCVKISAPKCPPLPSLPKCPECPPCQSTADPSSDSSCTKTTGKKKKDIWQRLRECTKRKMSTYVGPALYFENETALSLHHPTRHFSTSSIVTARFPSDSDSPPPLPPWKSNKCKTIEEVCGEKVDKKIEELECKAMDCPRDPNAECYPEKPRCAGAKESVQKNSDKSRGSQKSSINCENKKNHRESSQLEKSVEKIDYSKIKCEPPKLMELGPCPTPPLSLGEKQNRMAGTVGRRVSLPLPKPPSAPVVLCTCAPPPKLHPGSCPCYVETENSKAQSRTEPCPKKPETCPEIRIFYCPPDLRNKDDCNGEKSSKT